MLSEHANRRRALAGGREADSALPPKRFTVALKLNTKVPILFSLLFVQQTCLDRWRRGGGKKTCAYETGTANFRQAYQDVALKTSTVSNQKLTARKG